MNTTGALILFVCVGILLFAGIHALDNLHDEINTTNDKELTAQNEVAKAIENPILMTFGYGLLLIATIILVKSFKDM